MSVVRLGINGFGRIGRFTFRSTFAGQLGKGKVMAINDPFMSNDYLAYLLKYDSVHGRFPGTVSTGEGFIDAGCGPMRVTANKNPADLP